MGKAGKVRNGGLECSMPLGSCLAPTLGIISVTIENNNNKKKLPSFSELLVVKERSEDLIRFKSSAEWFVYRKWFLGGLR